MLTLQRLPTGEYGTNCYLLACPRTGKALLVDPGADPEKVLARGYAVVRHTATGALVRAVGDVTMGDLISVQVADGHFDAEVK